MVATVLPQPQAAGPIAGAPGHFAHHDWLTAATEALDQALGQRAILLQLSPGAVQSVATNTFTPLRCEVVTVKSPGCPAHTITGNNLLTLGDDWPTGIYRVDFVGAFAAPGSPAYSTACRTARVMVNGAVPITMPNLINSVASNGNARPAPAVGFGCALLKALDTVQVEVRHDYSGNLDTAIAACLLQLQYLFPATVAVTP